MILPARFCAVVFALTVSLGFSGCLPISGKSWGSSSSSSRWSENGTTTTFTVTRLTADNQPYLLVVSNASGTGGGGGSGRHQGELRAKDGREIVWTCATQDGRSGEVVIDGQVFDLTRGALFLVSTKEMTTRVEQLVMDLGQLPEGSLLFQKLREVAKGHPRIATFLESCKDRK